MNSRSIPSTAVCIEPVVALVLKEPGFARFLQVVPEFEAVFTTSKAAYSTINALNRNDDPGLHALAGPIKRILGRRRGISVELVTSVVTGGL